MRERCSEVPHLTAEEGPQPSTIFGLDTKVTLPSSVPYKNVKVSMHGPRKHILINLEDLCTPGNYNYSLRSNGFSKGRKLPPNPGTSPSENSPGGEKTVLLFCKRKIFDHISE